MTDERPTLRNIGKIKSRRVAKYAADVHQRRDSEQLLLIFAFLYRREQNPQRKRRFRMIISCSLQKWKISQEIFAASTTQSKDDTFDLIV